MLHFLAYLNPKLLIKLKEIVYRPM